MATKKVPDEIISESYTRTRSIPKTAIEVGLAGNAVYQRLNRLGLVRRISKRLSVEQQDKITQLYSKYRGTSGIEKLAEEVGCSVVAARRFARKTGLTQKDGSKPWGRWLRLTEHEARKILEKFKQSRWDISQFCKREKYSRRQFSLAMERFFPGEWHGLLESKVSRQPMYRLGASFEYRVRDDLRKHGYFVLRSPRSGSPIDLIAIRPKAVLLVQCKRGGQLKEKEWNALFDLAKSTQSVALLAETETGRGIRYWRLLDWKQPGKREELLGRFLPESA